MKILNAFSLNMLPVSGNMFDLDVDRITIGQARAVIEGLTTESAVGHAETAAIFTSLLGIEVPCHRVTVTLEKEETVLVGQYIGPRLPEGATSLPEGARVDWFLVTVF